MSQFFGDTFTEDKFSTGLYRTCKGFVILEAPEFKFSRHFFVFSHHVSADCEF